MDFISACAVGITAEFFEKRNHFLSKNVGNIFGITNGKSTETHTELCNSCKNTLENVVKVKTPYGLTRFKAFAVIEVG